MLEIRTWCDTCGAKFPGENADGWQTFVDMGIRFCPVCVKGEFPWYGDRVTVAVNAERERCAKIAESICQHPKGMWKCETWEAAKQIAKKIRES